MNKLLLFCCCILAFSAIGQENNTIAVNLNKTFSITEVDEQARFYCEACEALPTLKEKTICAKKKMVEVLQENLEYPDGVSCPPPVGKCVIGVVIDEKGKIIQQKILRDIGQGMGQIALETTDVLKKWIPAKKNGQSVKMSFFVPVEFVLNKSDNY